MAKDKNENEKIDLETIKVVESGKTETSVPADVAKPGAVRKVRNIVIQTF